MFRHRDTGPTLTQRPPNPRDHPNHSFQRTNNSHPLITSSSSIPNATNTTATMPLPPLPYQTELLIAQLATQLTSLLTRQILTTLPLHRRPSLSKPDLSPVTLADFASQALLITTLHHHFPTDAFVGEEDASSLRSDPHLASQVFDLITSLHLSDDVADGMMIRPRDVDEMCEMIDLGGNGRGGGEGRFWALDPVDGTASFLRGGQYAVSVALVEQGREVVGVLGCPNLKLSEDGRVKETVVDEEGSGLMLAAVRGQGAMVRPMGTGGLLEARRIDRTRRSEKVELSDLHFIDSSLSTATVSQKVRELAAMAGAQYPGTELYSSHMRYAALILGGRGHVQVRYPATKDAQWCLWDHSGSQLIYAESGAGVVTDLYGNPIDFGKGRRIPNWGLVTADASCHAKVLELVSRMIEAEKQEA